MQNYKDLKVWEMAHQFTLNVYSVTKQFPKEEMFGLTTQLRRAAASIGANIAEGCGRSSQADLARFLQISLGSANESEYFLLLANDIGYLQGDAFESLYKQVNEVKAMLISLIQKVRMMDEQKLKT